MQHVCLTEQSFENPRIDPTFGSVRRFTLLRLPPLLQLDDLLQQHEAFKQQRLHAAAAAMASGNLQQQQQQVLGPEELQLVNVIRDVKASYRCVQAVVQLRYLSSWCCSFAR